MASEYEVSFKDDENVPELDNVYVCTALLNIQKKPTDLYTSKG